MWKNMFTDHHNNSVTNVHIEKNNVVGTRALHGICWELKIKTSKDALQKKKKKEAKIQLRWWDFQQLQRVHEGGRRSPVSSIPRSLSRPRQKAGEAGAGVWEEPLPAALRLLPIHTCGHFARSGRDRLNQSPSMLEGAPGRLRGRTSSRRRRGKKRWRFGRVPIGDRARCVCVCVWDVGKEVDPRTS